MQTDYKAKTKIFWKISRVVLISVMICVLCTSGFIYSYMIPMIEEALLDKKRDMCRNMCRQEINELEEIEVYARNITFDDAVQNFLKGNDIQGSYVYYTRILDMERRLKDYKMIYGSIIQDIFVIDDQGKVLETVNTYCDLPGEAVFSRLMEAGEASGFTERYSFNYRGTTGEKNTLAFVNSIYDKTGVSVELGKLVLLLDADEIDRALSLDEDIRIRLTSPDGTVLFDGLKEEGSAVYVDRFGDAGWEAAYQIENKAIAEEIGRISSMVIAVLAAVLACMSIVLIMVLSRVVKPLETLIRGMQRVAVGSRSEHIEIHTGDECEQAANVFNSMVESIDLYTQELVESEKKQYEARLKMLSYQLNPHFIYNTLNAIICLARKQDYEGIIDLTREFIVLLQSLLRTDLSAMTTVEREQEHIENYLRVLQKCYRNVPDIMWEIGEDIEREEIPRMILYPLVENSIFHGIVPSDRLCMLRVSITRQNEWTMVAVEDDGIGCSEEELEEIRKQLASERVESHIGLFNVNGRLRLIYGDSCLFSIERRAGGGTVIRFGFCNGKR